MIPVAQGGEEAEVKNKNKKMNYYMKKTAISLF